MNRRTEHDIEQYEGAAPDRKNDAVGYLPRFILRRESEQRARE
jgi:hypothetical protein